MDPTTRRRGTSPAAGLQQQCAAAIQEIGGFGGRKWLRELFEAVPREDFVPDRVWWPEQDGAGCYPLLDRAEDPERWAEAVYEARTALVTQIADGMVRPEDGPSRSGDFSSSISCALVVVQMLRHLDPQPGDRVLEIGTGTGYNTRLLTLRCGGNVTTIEVDPTLADAARARLAAAGDTARVVTGDGGLGHPGGAPYDLVESTVCVQEIPREWVEQTRRGGRILTPMTTPLGTDALALLIADGQGQATGHLVAGVDFMLMREQRGQRKWRDLGWPRLAGFRLHVGGPGGQRVWAPDD